MHPELLLVLAEKILSCNRFQIKKHTLWFNGTFFLLIPSLSEIAKLYDIFLFNMAYYWKTEGKRDRKDRKMDN